MEYNVVHTFMLYAVGYFAIGFCLALYFVLTKPDFKRMMVINCVFAWPIWFISFFANLLFCASYWIVVCAYFKMTGRLWWKTHLICWNSHSLFFCLMKWWVNSNLPSFETLLISFLWDLCLFRRILPVIPFQTCHPFRWKSAGVAREGPPPYRHAILSCSGLPHFRGDKRL